MDKDEFYDSLDGDISSSSNTSLTNENFELKRIPESIKSKTSFLIIKPPPKNHFKLCSRESSNSSLASQFESKCSLYCNGQNNTNKLDEHTNDISTIVPLYLGEKNIYDINKTRKCCSTSTLVSNNNPEIDCSQKSKDDGVKKETISPRKRRTRNRNFKNDPVEVQQVRSKSYLKIFHSRIGYPTSAKKTYTSDTSRSICGDTKRNSISSHSTERDEFQDAEDNHFETASYYFQAIAESENSKTSEYVKNHGSTSTFYSSSSCFRMASISEIFTDRQTPKSKKSLRRCTNSKLLPIPMLGGLGPDTVRNQNKMELRKKQLNYGQKASYKNRIKLLEMNILKNLKCEMEESNSVKNKV